MDTQLNIPKEREMPRKMIQQRRRFPSIIGRCGGNGYSYQKCWRIMKCRNPLPGRWPKSGQTSIFIFCKLMITKSVEKCVDIRTKEPSAKYTFIIYYSNVTNAITRVDNTTDQRKWKRKPKSNKVTIIIIIILRILPHMNQRLSNVDNDNNTVWGNKWYGNGQWMNALKYLNFIYNDNK